MLTSPVFISDVNGKCSSICHSLKFYHKKVYMSILRCSKGSGISSRLAFTKNHSRIAYIKTCSSNLRSLFLLKEM